MLELPLWNATKACVVWRTWTPPFINALKWRNQQNWIFPPRRDGWKSLSFFLSWREGYKSNWIFSFSFCLTEFSSILSLFVVFCASLSSLLRKIYSIFICSFSLVFVPLFRFEIWELYLYVCNSVNSVKEAESERKTSRYFLHSLHRVIWRGSRNLSLSSFYLFIRR